MDGTVFQHLPLQWGVVIGASLVAAALDVWSHRIPNGLTGSLLLSGLVWSAYSGGLGGLGLSLAACVILALPFVVLFIVAGGGAGDAKMMGAIGAWLGLWAGLVVLVGVAISGGVLAIVYAVAKGRGLALASNLRVMTSSWTTAAFGATRWQDVSRAMPPQNLMQVMPYGVAIFTGTCLAGLGVWLWQI